MEDVKESSDIISAFTLYKILQENFSKAKIIGEFEDKLNRFGNFFNISPYEYKVLICSFNEILIQKFDLMRDRNINIYICQDVESKDLYFKDKNVDKKIVAKHYKEIMEIFEVLEQISKIFYGCFSFQVVLQQKFADSFFEGKFFVDLSRGVSFDLSMIDDCNKEQINRNWYGKENLSTYINDAAEIIFNKIPVEISKLNYPIRTIVEEKIKSRQKTKTL